MKRCFFVAFGLLVLLAATPAWSEEIQGVFGGQLGGQTSATGAALVKGWAVAESGVWQVVIQVEGTGASTVDKHDVGNGNYGKSRPDIEVLYPGFPDSEAAGFSYILNTTNYANGQYKVSAKVITLDGTVAQLSSKTIEFNNNTSILVPFGRILNPQRSADLFGTCDPANPRQRLVAIEGWVLDLGDEINDAGVGYVELMIDNAGPVANTRSGCRWDAAAGGFTSCYGLVTPAIERNYPFARDAQHAGFRFVIDVGQLIQFGYSQGHHTLGIRAGDVSNQVADVDEWSVFFRCIEDVNEGSYGRIESPRAGRTYSGNITVQGWAIDWEEVDFVRLRVDGTPIGTADYGEEDGIFDTRPGVFSQYYNYPNVLAPVWRLANGFDTTQISDGLHQLQLIVIDKEGDSTLVGEVTFRVNNSID
jgi:hypothetical protein